ncbi:MAG: DUF4276 family protein [Bacteroidota bacterium]|nr:DUF4276 family protein [Bacteroidota bacterium]
MSGSVTPRLLIHVEGQTEENFVNEVLGPHLITRGLHSVGARLIGNHQERIHRGGIRAWSTVRNDIVRHLREDRTCYATTMVDYYGLPKRGRRGWPGQDAPDNANAIQKAELVESAITQDIRNHLGDRFNSRRFIPFVMMHEFKALLFSNCSITADVLGVPSAGPWMRSILESFQTPEEINDSAETAPSKRIQNLVGDFQKPVDGILALMKIGLPAIRTSCPHFGDWLGKLEQLAVGQSP